MIHGLHSGEDLLLRHSVQPHALGKILAQQPVTLLMEAPLPTMVRPGKVPLTLSRLSNGGMPATLPAIVIGDRVNPVLPGF